MERNKLKLFVWMNFSPDYTGGMAFAIAEDEIEARRLIEAFRGYDVSDWGELSVYPLSKKIARAVNGGG